MGKIIDLTGQKFGRLTVLRFDKIEKHRTYWFCRCECGNEKVIKTTDFKHGNTVSCGCYQKENRHKANFKHGLKTSPTYTTWKNIKTRCYNTKSYDFEIYGKRGITMCDQWKNDFMAFYKDMGERPSPKHSIDRIDVNGNYEPANCRWATQKEQSNNTRTNVYLEYKGEILTISQWADRYKINYHTLIKRINKSGWSIEKALLTPLMINKYKFK